MNEEGLMVLFGGFIILFVVLIIIAIIFYILKSIGLYGLASNVGMQNPWLAWVPIGDTYIMAKLAKDEAPGSFNIPNLEIIFPVSTVVLVVASGLPIIGSLLMIAYAVLFFIVIYMLYKKYRPDQAVLWLVLSIIGLAPIFMFIMRNDRPVNRG